MSDSILTGVDWSCYTWHAMYYSDPDNRDKTVVKVLLVKSGHMCGAHRGNSDQLSHLAGGQIGGGFGLQIGLWGLFLALQ